jgi:hypothetical protein
VAWKKAGKAAKKKKALNYTLKELGKLKNQMAMPMAHTYPAGIPQAYAVGSGAYGRGAYGRGAYAANQPIAVNSLFKEFSGRRAKTSSFNDETGRIRVSRREYVMRVVAPATTVEFQNTSFSINPGLDGVFAWLSQIAQNYDEYELEHLVFHYKPVISQASTSGAMGSILLSTNYNAGAEKFESFREMAEYMGTLETRVCDPCMFGVECDPTKHGSSPIEYIRTGTVPVGEDIKTYDLGLFQLATADVSSFAEGTLLGHLYVEYQVVLGKPKLFGALGKAIKCDMFKSPVTSITGVSFVYQCTPNPANNLGTTLQDSGVGNGAVITFPDNFYGRVCINYFIGATTVVFSALAYTGNVTNPSICGPAGTAANEIAGTTGVSTSFIQFYVDVSASSGGVANTVILGGTLGTFYYSNLDITQVNPDFDQW